MRRILVVDDEPSIRRVLAGLITKTFDELEVVEAGTDEQALKLLHTKPMDLVVTDITHPSQGGLELLRMIRQDPALRNIPVVIQSGTLPNSKYENAAWALGARAVLGKPYDLGRLIAIFIGALGDLPAHPDAAHLTLGTESPGLDYKEALPLESKAERAAFAKDVIAIANFGGGKVIVGVAEVSRGHFEPKGLEESELKALETTKVNQGIRKYLDPPVHVSSRRVEYHDHSFIFLEIPADADLVMPACAHEPELFMGRIYGRTAAAESAPLESSKEIRAIIHRLARGQLQELLTAGDQLKGGSKNVER